MHFLGGLRSTRGLPLLGSAASHPLARRRHLPQNAQWLVRTLQPTATAHTPQVGFPQLREREEMLWGAPTRSRGPHVRASHVQSRGAGSTPIDTRPARALVRTRSTSTTERHLLQPRQPPAPPRPPH